MVKIIEKLSDSERKALKNGVLEVTGKAMNRTALGVVDAVFTLYPTITFAELKEMLPDSINPSAPKNYKSLFKPYSDRLYGVVQAGSIRKECEDLGLDINKSHFTAEGETFRTSDGIEVLVSKTWESKDTETGENDLKNLIDHVVQHGIRVTNVEKNKAFNKGSYNIEVINPILLEAIQNPVKKKFPWWILLLIILVLLALVLFKVQGIEANNETASIDLENHQEEMIIGKEPMKTTTISEIKSQIDAGINTEGESVNFNEILFEKDSDVILPESESYLSEVLVFLNEVPELTLLIVGHTSSEGEESYNQKLSTKRAASVANFFQANGIQSSRLTLDGKGSSQPVASNHDEQGKSLNRRIEFVVTNDGVENN
jgi:outer membrane protein OmpA-like peptidoglycan-associated protein